MIIHNKFLGNKIEDYQLKNIKYRNAFCQRQSNISNKIEQCSGIIYMLQNSHLIVSSRFSNNIIAGYTLFFHKDRRYLYGNWHNNQPHGTALFLIEDIVIIAQYFNGKLIEGTKILIIFENFNIGVILQYDSFEGWSIKYKSDVYCQQHIQKLINNCCFGHEVIYSLVKYINSYLIDVTPSLKLRIVDNTHYRYGFDKGLGIIFDDNANIKSIGLENYNCIKQGTKITDINWNNQQQIKNNVIGKRSNLAIGKIYSKSKQNKYSFINQCYSDPSVLYFKQFELLLSSPLIKRVFTGFIMNSSPSISSPVKYNQNKSNKKHNQLEYNQQFNINQQIYGFQQKNRNLTLKAIQQIQIGFKQINKTQNFNIPQKKSDNMLSFQNFPERYRLSIICDQLKHSIIHSNVNKSENTSDKLDIIQRQNSLINKLNQTQEKQIIGKENKVMQDEELIVQQEPIALKNQEIISILNNKQNQRVKKKIFDQSTIKKIQKSPVYQGNKQISPSKRRLKIFSQTPQNKYKLEYSLKKLSSIDQETPQNTQKKPIKTAQIPLAKNIRIQQSYVENQININHTDEMNLGNRSFEQSDRIEQDHATEIKNNKKLTFTANLNQKKDNQVYLNRFSNGPYNNYINRPISILQTQNKLSLRQQCNSSYSPNSKIKMQDPAKKNIIDTVPYKQNKIKTYMKNKSNIVYSQKLQKCEKYLNTADKKELEKL